MLFLSMMLCSAKGALFAQEQKPSFFVGASFTSNTSQANIQAYDGTDLCGVFHNGKEGAPSMFGGITFPLSDKFSIDAKLEYDNLSTSLNLLANPTGEMPNAYDPATGQTVPITRERIYDASIDMAAGAALLSYSIFPMLRVSAGPYLGYLVNRSYNETEELIPPTDPSAVYHLSGTTTRPISSGSITTINRLQGGMEFGASFEQPFEPHLALRPSFSVMIPVTAFSSIFSSIPTGGLNLIPFGVSLSLVYHLSESPKQEPPPPAIVGNVPNSQQQAEIHHIETPIPTLNTPPKRAMLSVSVKALGVGEDGKEVSEPVISIERTHVTEVYPMLHYVFFDDGSSQIPERYHRETAATRGAFHEKDLFTANALEIHHHVLDIIGERLAENPNTSVTLVGTRSEHSPDDTLLWSVIALNRARSVQDYLDSVWGISRDRIRLKERSLPDAASDDHNPFGQAENRRVEIIPSSPEITAPLWTERIERVASPPRIDFEPEITANSGIRTATITVYQHGHVLRTIDALSDSSASDYLWTIDDRSMPDDAPDAADSLQYVFSAVDSLGDTAQASGVIRLHKQSQDRSRHVSDTLLDKQIERYSLILFDYSSSQLDKKESEEIINEMASSVRNKVHVTLTGHTDKTGDEAFNDRLARERVTRAAQMLEAQLKKLGEKIPPLAIESRGSRDNLFDNSIPEGRVLSRTVRAMIVNDLK